MGETKAQSAPQYGLVLDLPGAAEVPHRVGDYGEFSASEPTALEETGLSLEEAKALDSDEGCPLKLVKLSKAQIAAVEAANGDAGEPSAPEEE